jgi:hypothetical protein
MFSIIVAFNQTPNYNGYLRFERPENLFFIFAWKKKMLVFIPHQDIISSLSRWIKTCPSVAHLEEGKYESLTRRQLARAIRSLSLWAIFTNLLTCCGRRQDGVAVTRLSKLYSIISCPSISFRNVLLILRFHSISKPTPQADPLPRRFLKTFERMNRHLLFLLCICLSLHALFAQPAQTANDFVMPYDQGFRFGANLGNYPPWTNKQVADIAVGKPSAGLPGVGVNAFRGSLPEHFLETWGYNVRLADYQYFHSLGAKENLAFLGYPSQAHRDPAKYCDTLQSALFANMYLPIWDGGANGTPVNDQNYYALYLWKAVNLYKPYIRFWEIWNEPDFTYNTAVAYAPPGAPGNWWDNNPSPCDYALMAPIFHYVRLLRISYEVIKTADPAAYVCIGGIGNPAFLDAVLRNTDNPAGGSTGAEFPLRGGAYFDVLSYHAYPHFDGSMWEFPPGGGLFFYRHSDRGLDGLFARQDALQVVLESHGYDGSTYPQKEWVISETNLPRKVFQQYIGSDEAQRNYLLKVLTESQARGIGQLYVFNIADLSSEADAWNEFLLMGLFKNLSAYSPFNYELTDAGIAWKTAADFFKNRQFDAALTAQLALPAGVRGGAFSGLNDTLFVLWTKTSIDNSEQASANYTFPNSLNVSKLNRWAWDFSATKDTAAIDGKTVELSGAPVFLQRRAAPVTATADAREDAFSVTCFPNPAGRQLHFFLLKNGGGIASLRLVDARGLPVRLDGIPRLSGSGVYALDLPAQLPGGLYYLEVRSEEGGVAVWKVVVAE